MLPDPKYEGPGEGGIRTLSGSVLTARDCYLPLGRCCPFSHCRCVIVAPSMAPSNGIWFRRQKIGATSRQSIFFGVSRDLQFSEERAREDSNFKPSDP